jgi:hypothetical protein
MIIPAINIIKQTVSATMGGKPIPSPGFIFAQIIPPIRADSNRVIGENMPILPVGSFSVISIAVVTADSNRIIEIDIARHMINMCAVLRF